LNTSSGISTGTALIGAAALMRAGCEGVLYGEDQWTPGASTVAAMPVTM
jgi:hypothetical protein